MDSQEVRVQGAPLDIPGSDLQQTPQFPGSWWSNNFLVRGIAHLFGFDGSHARALRCSAVGVLRVRPEDASGNVPAYSTAGGAAVTVSDRSTPTNQLAVNSDGSLNVQIGVGGVALGVSGSSVLMVELDPTSTAAIATSVQTGVAAALTAYFSKNVGGELHVTTTP